jgi:hypothetical protein
MDDSWDRQIWWRYWRRAMWTAWVIRWLPYVRLVGLNGSMVTGSLNKESDIDFYVVTANGRIYTTRAFVTAVVHCLGVRRHGRHIAGRICLNRYAVRSYLRIDEANLYHARVFHNLIPLYAEEGVYEEYRKANHWMREKGYPVADHRPVLTLPWPFLGLKRLMEAGLYLPTALLEPALRRLQLRRTARDIRAAHPGSRVVISDRELRFHLAKAR